MGEGGDETANRTTRGPSISGVDDHQPIHRPARRDIDAVRGRQESFLNALNAVLEGSVLIVTNQGKQDDRIFLALITVDGSDLDIMIKKIDERRLPQPPFDQVPLGGIHADDADACRMLLLKSATTRETHRASASSQGAPG